MPVPRSSGFRRFFVSFKRNYLRMANSPCLEPPEVTRMRKHSRITLATAREISNLNGDEYINVIKSYMLQSKEKEDKNKKNKGLAPKENPKLRQKKDRIER